MASLQDLREELERRGYDYLSDKRANWFINAAYAELCDLEPWPFLEATKTQAAPIDLSDARSVLSVNDATGAAINYVDRRVLGLAGTVFTNAGTATNWYFENNNLQSYPQSTGVLTVRYIKSANKLVQDTDTVLVPDRYVDLLVDGANIRALKDTDNYQEVVALRQEWDRGVQAMRLSLLGRQYEPGYILITQSHDWG